MRCRSRVAFALGSLLPVLVLSAHDRATNDDARILADIRREGLERSQVMKAFDHAVNVVLAQSAAALCAGEPVRRGRMIVTNARCRWITPTSIPTNVAAYRT